MTEPNKRKVAFREEALNLLGALDHEPTLADVKTAHKFDCFECTLHNEPKNPKPQNCRDNPYCINRLGLEKFSSLLKKEEQDADKKKSTLKRRGIHEIPSGLKNEGNFCYVNSFLQVFFNDPKWRQVVYNWRPSPNYIKPAHPKLDIEAVMNSLQRVFYCLEYTPFEETTTYDFTKVLRLGSTQQDAQEFTIMFFGALERHLPSHPNGKQVFDFMKKHFFGKISTRTWCECGKRDNRDVQPFLSLQLPIEGHTTLLKAIEHHFAVESLHECRCEYCGRTDKVSRKAEIVELPDVMIFQLNRYVNDPTKLTQRKLRAPLAYPRILRAKLLQPSLPENEDHDYELFAVMIHEGDNTHCGHYYDLVKHPYIDQWYKYNDEYVEALSKVPGFDIRSNVGKPTADMRACYGLLYRKKEEIFSCEPPASTLCEPWRQEFDDHFNDQIGSEMNVCASRVREIRTRYTELNNVFGTLKAHTDRYKNEKNLTFVPLDLLTDIIDKERKYAQKQLEKFDKEESEPAVKINKISNGYHSPVKRKERVGKVSREEIAGTLNTSKMKLCPHGLVHIDAVLFGDVKIVSRTSADNLLSRYNFVLKKVSRDGESPAALLTGNDLCLECAKLMQKESHFKTRLDSTMKLVNKIQREKQRDSLNPKPKPSDHFYVSKKALINFRKNAEQQFRHDNWLDDDISLVFIPGAKQLSPTNISPARSRASRARKRRLAGADGIEMNGFTETSEVQEEVKEILDTVLAEVCEAAVNGKDKSEEKEIENDEESRPPTPLSVKPNQIIFNRNLNCEHNKLNIPEYRLAVSPEEWAELTSYFPNFYTVNVDDEVCSECRAIDETRRNEAVEQKQQMREIRQNFGQIVRVIEKRLPLINEIGTKYTYGICSNFINDLRTAFRRNVASFDLPKFCQECVLCKHNMPCRPVIVSNAPIPRNEIIPITDKEWQSLTSEWPAEQMSYVTPIHLNKKGEVNNFCIPCFDEMMNEERLNRMVFEDKFIYVKVESADEDKNKPIVAEGRSRRGTQKNLLKFKMSHTDTVRDLKIKLYPKTNQSPVDQLLYNGDTLLEDDLTLSDAMIEPENINNPLKLIVHMLDESSIFFDQEREPEMGFTGTALTF